VSAPTPLRHRRCIVLHGEREATLQRAAQLVSHLASACVVEGGSVSAARSRQLLGQSFDAVVLDLHAGAAADTLGRCHGLVRGGGALILCLPPTGCAVRRPELAVHPYTSADVGRRFWRRLEQHLARLDTAPPSEPLEPAPPAPLGSAEQAGVVQRLLHAFTGAAPRLVALIAERGRGKSSALGLALAAARATRPGLCARVTASNEDAAVELFRFAPPDGDRLRFVAPGELIAAGAEATSSPDVIVVDEAAQLPVATLRALVANHPRATIAFATTTHGYEGTGRGFVLRFLDWLAREPRPCERLGLNEPIRWSAGDPLERFIYDLLALDTEIHTPRVEPAALLPRRLEPDELARDERLLRSTFGLLIRAHYRTTPADLERLLDAPNLAVYAVIDAGEVLGATLVAREGGLSNADSESLARGEWRIRGHALADTLIVHAGRPDAGELDMLRSVRIATHPELRRRGVARALVEHVHAAHAPDLFGSVFGATSELLEFRRALGYRLVRVGSSRGASSGEPSVVMVRPVSARARALVDELERDLARNLPLQLELLAADAELGIEPALRRALRAEVGAAPALDPIELRRRVEIFARGAQTMEAALYALDAFLRSPDAPLERLEPQQWRLLERRVLSRQSWRSAAAAAGHPDVPTAMRALRPALRRLIEP
jgi:tRNA(Met) cytidine acetyltransferase